ncbi:9630_t:CDS:2 [Diversispora eburnea]|uniref:9630_t:CDS:1 n=1 Tax=Diversispora eburnea TaxID=1213867 RepID=A0A9N9EZS9_9GLOM|nr:9630_t:CDS:2 [Diversispora eburnea]
MKTKDFTPVTTDSLTRSKIKLFVRKVPYDATDSEFEAFFSEIGPIRSCFLIKESENTKSVNNPSVNEELKNVVKNLGYGFVKYALSQDAERALKQLKKVKFRGQRTLRLEYALKKHQKPINKKDDKKRFPPKKYLKDFVMDDKNNVMDNENNENSVSDDENAVSDDGNAVSDDENFVSDDENAALDDENAALDDENIVLDDVKDDNDCKEITTERNPEGTVLFIRNLAFEAEEEELGAIFRQFGPLRYYVITRDNITKRSRGTGFVCFVHKEHADSCLAEANKMAHISTDSSKKLITKRKGKELIYKSILTADPSDSQAQKFTLHVIFPNTLDAESLPASEVNKRSASYTMRKNLLSKNPNLYISKIRLSIRNIPRMIDELHLKHLGKEAIKKFKVEVKNGKRNDLSESEKKEGWNKFVHIKQAKIVRSKDKIDSATQKLQSKGYGFLEYSEHAHALAALRYLNNNPEIFGDNKRLIVEFSVENMIIVKNRVEKLKNSKDTRNININDNNDDTSKNLSNKKFTNDLIIKNDDDLNLKRKR